MWWLIGRGSLRGSGETDFQARGVLMKFNSEETDSAYDQVSLRAVFDRQDEV